MQKKEAEDSKQLSSEILFLADEMAGNAACLNSQTYEQLMKSRQSLKSLLSNLNIKSK